MVIKVMRTDGVHSNNTLFVEVCFNTYKSGVFIV